MYAVNLDIIPPRVRQRYLDRLPMKTWDLFMFAVNVWLCKRGYVSIDENERARQLVWIRFRALSRYFHVKHSIAEMERYINRNGTEGLYEYLIAGRKDDPSDPPDTEKVED